MQKQNPFLRLKRYRGDLIENHATEILGTCLLLSSNIKREFVRFLFDGDDKVDLADVETLDVSTQQQLGGYGIVDLLLEAPGTRNIVVEVKVEAEETGPQIQKYRDWLEQTKKGEKYVFSLVKRPSDFKIKDFGGDARHTWRKLCDELYNKYVAVSGKQSLLEPTEKTILEYLLDYMEAERIVSNWTPQQILDYARGVTARKALGTLFEQVKEKLMARQPCPFLEPEIVLHDKDWPCLKIGMKSWKGIFGNQGYLNKLYMYYQTTAAWDGAAKGFLFEIVLWHKPHRNNWALTKPKLAQWIAVLRKNNFRHTTYLKGSRELEGDADKYNFSEAPGTISAWSKDRNVSDISESDLRKMIDSRLVDLCVDRVDQHCAVISAFK